MNIDIHDINSALYTDPGGYIYETDSEFYHSLRELAADIRDHRKDLPIILLSGPSGSGKTTTAMMLERLLDTWGCASHSLSMDNYFAPFNKEEAKLAADGKLDLESPNRVDIPFLNEQLDQLLSCREVDLPTYDFESSKRQFDGRTLTRKPGELVILEGIHALNPNVVTIPDQRTVKIYVSVRTRIRSGGVVLHPSKIRLMRRMLRDQEHRGRSIEETFRLYQSVERGELAYIMPYKHRATHQVDTFFRYEVGAYKPLLDPQLEEFGGKNTKDLRQVLDMAVGIPSEQIPAPALIREFIGNSMWA